MIDKHSDEVLEALDITNVKAWILSEKERDNLLKVVLEKYAVDSKYQYPLWENLINTVSVDYKFSWQWYQDLLRDKEIILFFEQVDDTTFFKFSNGKDLVKVMHHCYRFISYVTDVRSSFLFCYNDHDYLIATGKSKEWLINYPKVLQENIMVHE